jgi:hypothetical protein
MHHSDAEAGASPFQKKSVKKKIEAQQKMRRAVGIFSNMYW